MRTPTILAIKRRIRKEHRNYIQMFEHADRQGNEHMKSVYAGAVTVLESLHLSIFGTIVPADRNESRRLVRRQRKEAK